MSVTLFFQSAKRKHLSVDQANYDAYYNVAIARTDNGQIKRHKCESYIIMLLLRFSLCRQLLMSPFFDNVSSQSQTCHFDFTLPPPLLFLLSPSIHVSITKASTSIFPKTLSSNKSIFARTYSFSPLVILPFHFVCPFRMKMCVSSNKLAIQQVGTKCIQDWHPVIQSIMELSRDSVMTAPHHPAYSK